MAVRERTILAVLIAGVVVLIAFPPVYGWTIRPPDRHFTGLTGLYGTDQAFYLAWGPRQAQDGHWLFEDKYNGPPDRRMVFNLLWLVMGWTARLTGLSVVAVYHIERVLFSILLLLIIHRILRAFIPQPGWRLVALALVALGSGFGWLLPPSWGKTPDLWIVESNLFLMMLGEVNLPAGACLFLLALLKGYQALSKHPRRATSAGLLTLALGAVYPYAVISVYAILGVAAAYVALQRIDVPIMRQLWRHEGQEKTRGQKRLARIIRWLWRRFKPVLLVYGKIVIISVFFVIYDGYLVLTNPNLTAGQALYRSPDPLQYFVGYGVVSILALLGVLYFLKNAPSRLGFPVLWAATTFVLIYVPISFQMQLIVGVQVPLAILAVYGLSRLFSTMGSPLTAGPPWRRALAALALFCVLAFSTVTNIDHYRAVLARVREFHVPEYLDLHDYEAMTWLKTQTMDHDVVLASRTASVFIPLVSSNPVFLGDYAGTCADFERKIVRLKWFFADDDKRDDEIRAFLDRNRIRYIFFDQRLRAESQGRMLDRLEAQPQIETVFDNGHVTILRVDHAVTSRS